MNPDIATKPFWEIKGLSSLVSLIEFSGEELRFTVPSPGIYELLLCQTDGKMGFALSTRQTEDTLYETEGFLPVLQRSQGPFSLVLSGPKGRFLLKGEMGPIQRSALKKGLLTWGNASHGPSPLLSALDQGADIKRHPLFPEEAEAVRDFYPWLSLTPEGEYRLSTASIRTGLLKGALSHVKGLSLRFGKLTLTYQSSLSPEEFPPALYPTAQREGAEPFLPLSVVSCIKKEAFYEVKAVLSLKEAPLRRTTWIPALHGPADGEELGLFLDLTYGQRIFYNFFYKGTYKRKKIAFFPSNTEEGALSFLYRLEVRPDRLPFHLKEGAALLSFLFTKRWDARRNIQLIFEKNSQTAQDNGFYYFAHCMEHREEAPDTSEVFYLIRKNSRDLPRLAPYMDHVIQYGTLRHMRCLLAARLLVTTDTRYHCYPKRSRGSLLFHFLRKKPVVFLQHGVTALKQVGPYYGKDTPGACSLFIVTSEKEKALIKEEFGYPEKDIAEAGFARWDALTDKSEGKRDILIMPSWRGYMNNLSTAEFYQSSYFRNYMALLNSGRLARLLEEEDLTVSFYLHSKFRSYIHFFASISPRVRLVRFGEEEVNDLIMGCRLLITDYSSVCWDALYLGKPVLFYQFDRPAYLEAHGSYLDMTKDLPGDAAFTASDLVELLRGYVKDDFALREPYLTRREEYLPRRDQENSRRIREAISAKWPPKKGRGK